MDRSFVFIYNTIHTQFDNGVKKKLINLQGLLAFYSTLHTIIISHYNYETFPANMIHLGV